MPKPTVDELRDRFFYHPPPNQARIDAHAARLGHAREIVAHQINNPIGAILNSAEYALLCQDDEQAHAILLRALNDNLAEAKRCATEVARID